MHFTLSLYTVLTIAVHLRALCECLKRLPDYKFVVKGKAGGLLHWEPLGCCCIILQETKNNKTRRMQLVTLLGGDVSVGVPCALHMPCASAHALCPCTYRSFDSQLSAWHHGCIRHSDSPAPGVTTWVTICANLHSAAAAHSAHHCSELADISQVPVCRCRCAYQCLSQDQ